MREDYAVRIHQQYMAEGCTEQDADRMLLECDEILMLLEEAKVALTEDEITLALNCRQLAATGAMSFAEVFPSLIGMQKEIGTTDQESFESIADLILQGCLEITERGAIRAVMPDEVERRQAEFVRSQAEP
jgi:hypothetical protein